MKKILSLSLALILGISMLLTAVSCAGRHPIEKFKNKMEEADNYQMTITMSNVPLLGTFTMTTKIDGDIQYTPAGMFHDEEYTQTVGDVEYTYTKTEDGEWIKTQSAVEEDTSDITNDETMNDLFNPENYEKVKGEENTYQQKKDVQFDDFEDVVIIIDDNSCTLEMLSKEEGYSMKIVISKIGEIELTLPSVE